MHPPAYPHNDIQALHSDVYWLHGSIKMGPGMRMSRNMVILKNGNDLTLINPVRMNDEGLAALDRLGEVKYIIRLGDFHGLDDAFYLARYQCKFWAQAGQATYLFPTPDTIITANTKSPHPDAEFFIFEHSQYPEAALLLKNHNLLITTDSVQYYADWQYFSGFTKFVFKLFGFKVGVNIGSPWLKRVTRKGDSLKPDFERLLALDFDSLIAAHGSFLSSGAKQALKTEVSHAFE